jgi:hypothetical protein
MPDPSATHLGQRDSGDVLDNLLALGQMIQRCERTGTGWMLTSDYGKVTPEFRYELRIFDGPARAIYRGRTATHAASKVMAAFDEHHVGWES